MSDSAAGLASKLTSLHPFSRSSGDDEDLGDVFEPDASRAAGHQARTFAASGAPVRVSTAIQSFMVDRRLLSSRRDDLSSNEPPPELRRMLQSPIRAPPELLNRSHPLTEYFISSSHNTYLLAHQLYGGAGAVAYQTALAAGSRCVEIDAWDDEEHPDEPKVTHGYTLAAHVPFRKVCEAIRDVVDKEAAATELPSGYRAAPILLSLENHCSTHGQRRLVQIMKEVWGTRLLTEAVPEKGARQQLRRDVHVTLGDLQSKIALIVEYHPQDITSSSPGVDASKPDQNSGKDQEDLKGAKIVPELAELGVYAQSVKPTNSSWYESKLENGPHDHLINVSETGLSSLLPANGRKIGLHNAEHLMRVYPKGTRISSDNMNPVPFWGVGAQICALNWQTFDHSMQLNEALFAGSDGYVLKPVSLRAIGLGVVDQTKRKKLRLHVVGATALPIPSDRNAAEVKPYVSCTLIHPNDVDRDPPKRKTAGYKQHKLGIIHRGENPPSSDPFWDETLEWEYDDDELVFLRLLVKSDDKFARNPVLAVTAVRLLYVSPNWHFLHLLDLKGKKTGSTLFVRFEIENVS